MSPPSHTHTQLGLRKRETQGFIAWLAHILAIPTQRTSYLNNYSFKYVALKSVAPKRYRIALNFRGSKFSKIAIFALK